MAETTASVVVEMEPEEAFERFTDRFGDWWPPAYTWSGESLVDIGIEPGVDGMCYEVGPHGFRCDFGRVLGWEPGERLVFSWQISANREPVPDPEEASEVVVRFRPVDGGTAVELTHRHFERHGEGGEEYCRMMGSEQGWPWILEQFAESAG